MKKIILLASLLSAPCFAAVPWFIVDVPDTNADVCVISVDAGSAVEVSVVDDVTLGRICKLNMSAVGTGAHTVSAIAKSALWDVASTPVIFPYTKPTSIAPVTSPRLTKF